MRPFLLHNKIPALHQGVPIGHHFMRTILQNIINLFRQKKPTYILLPVRNDNNRIPYKTTTILQRVST